MVIDQSIPLWIFTSIDQFEYFSCYVSLEMYREENSRHSCPLRHDGVAVAIKLFPLPCPYTWIVLWQSNHHNFLSFDIFWEEQEQIRNFSNSFELSDEDTFCRSSFNDLGLSRFPITMFPYFLLWNKLFFLTINYRTSFGIPFSKLLQSEALRKFSSYMGASVVPWELCLPP